MSFGEFKSIVNHLLSRASISAPLKRQIQISMNAEKKLFSLTVPIFKSQGAMPKSVEEYVSKRRSHTFKPHSTSFQEKDGEVLLVQEISFDEGSQDSFRQHFIEFWEMAKRCHQMLKEIALEETDQRLVPIDSDLDE